MKFRRISESVSEERLEDAFKDAVEQNKITKEEAEKVIKERTPEVEDREARMKPTKLLVTESYLKDNYKYSIENGTYNVSIKGRNDLGRLIEMLKSDDIDYFVSKSLEEGYRYTLTFKKPITEEVSDDAVEFDKTAVDDVYICKALKEYKGNHKELNDMEITIIDRIIDRHGNLCESVEETEEETVEEKVTPKAKILKGERRHESAVKESLDVNVEDDGKVNVAANEEEKVVVSTDTADITIETKGTNEFVLDDDISSFGSLPIDLEVEDEIPPVESDWDNDDIVITDTEEEEEEIKEESLLEKKKTAKYNKVTDYDEDTFGVLVYKYKDDDEEHTEEYANYDDIKADFIHKTQEEKDNYEYVIWQKVSYDDDGSEHIEEIDSYYLDESLKEGKACESKETDTKKRDFYDSDEEKWFMAVYGPNIKVIKRISNDDKTTIWYRCKDEEEIEEVFLPTVTAPIKAVNKAVKTVKKVVNKVKDNIANKNKDTKDSEEVEEGLISDIVDKAKNLAPVGSGIGMLLNADNDGDVEETEEDKEILTEEKGIISEKDALKVAGKDYSTGVDAAMDLLYDIVGKDYKDSFKKYWKIYERDDLDDDKILDAKNKLFADLGISEIMERAYDKIWDSNGNLSESVKIVAGIDDYEPWSGAVDTWDKIVENGKVEELDLILEDIYPDGLSMTELNDILWHDSEWVLSELGIEEDEEEYEDDDIDGLDYSDEIEDEECARIEYCVVNDDGNNVECFDTEEEARKYAKKHNYDSLKKVCYDEDEEELSTEEIYLDDEDEVEEGLLGNLIGGIGNIFNN